MTERSADGSEESEDLNARLPEFLGADEDEADGGLTEVIQTLIADGHQPVQKDELAAVLRVVSISRSRLSRHSGPLPRTSDLREYDEIIENGAERIMRLAEKEQDHRHALDMREQALIERVQKDDALITKRGQNYGLAICIFIVLVAVGFAIMGHAGLAALLVGLDLVSLAAVFVAGRYLPGRSQSSGALDEAAERQRDQDDAQSSIEETGSPGALEG